MVELRDGKTAKEQCDPYSRQRYMSRRLGLLDENNEVKKSIKVVNFIYLAILLVVMSCFMIAIIVGD